MYSCSENHYDSLYHILLELTCRLLDIINGKYESNSLRVKPRDACSVALKLSQYSKYIHVHCTCMGALINFRWRGGGGGLAQKRLP